MDDFKDLGVKPEMPCYNGKKIEIDDVLNKQIVVCAYTITDSKYPKKPGDKCLYLEIKIDNEERLIFTSATMLMATLKLIDEKRFPFKTTIVKRNKRFEFS